MCGVSLVFSIMFTEPTSNLLQGPCLYGGGFHSLGYFLTKLRGALEIFSMLI